MEAQYHKLSSTDGRSNNTRATPGAARDQPCNAAYTALIHPPDGSGSMLEERYRVTRELTSADQQHDVLDVQSANSTLLVNKAACCCCCCIRTFVVDEGYIRCGEDGSGGFPMYGPGVHLYCAPFLSVGNEVEICSTRISNGPHTICTIQQGHIGVCEDMGQPVLLPPGMHQWHSPTLKFDREVDLSSNITKLGPYTVVTVDEGYAAICQDNGKQIILEGGTTTVLKHRGAKFEKFMSKKLNSDDLRAIEATSADNVNLHVEATIVWQIVDVAQAALTAADTMEGHGRGQAMDIGKLREDVLKQGRASLAMYVGELRYMDTFHLSATIQEQRRAASLAQKEGNTRSGEAPPEYTEYSKIFDEKRMENAVDHSNSITRRYGVEIISINIISAIPADPKLREYLAKGALATAQAEQIETQARAEAKAASIKVETDNRNKISEAEAEATSAKIRAEGQKEAAAQVLEPEVLPG